MKPPILLIGLANSNQDYLDAIQAELAGIRGALTKAKQGGHLDIQERNQFTFKTLADDFNDLDHSSRLAILHYSGHSSAAGLMLRQGGQDVLLDKNYLTTFLGAQHSLKLVFLNSCYSKELAEALVAVGVPMVIGTSSAVKDKMAAAVAGYFYQTLGGGSKTIQEAFNLTKSHFDQLPDTDELSFRGPIVDLDDSPWNLYLAQDKKETASWRLIPLSLLEKLQAIQGKRKLLLLMENEQHQGVYHKGLLNFLVDYPEVQPFSIWDFQQDAAAERIAVLNQVDVVLYLATPGLKTALENELDWVKAHLDKNKPHGLLACEGLAGDLKAYLQNENLAKPDSVILPNEQFTLEILLNSRQPLDAIFKFFLKEPLPKMIGMGNTPDLLKLAFNRLNFDDQRQRLDFSLRRFHLILLEGTPACGQELLIRTILDNPVLALGKNVERLNISVKTFLGNEELDENKLAFLLAMNLKIMAMNLDGLLPGLSQKLQQDDVVIVLNDIEKQEPDKFKSLLKAFWTKLNEQLPTSETLGRLFIIIVHKGYEAGVCCISDLNLVSDNQQLNALLLPPIKTLDYGVINKWHLTESPNFPAGSPFINLLQNFRQRILDKKYVGKAVEEICELMQVPIAHEVLKF
ncbi:MAG TPA: CHAT domain-containing protein [Saprospiraceae bacterium]|nr:CHAT domain-containing protein [Saprospiraceae bacterium]HMQ82689.1 CHAT domain-containing protein [Saprospiraceae bacterium]